MRKLFAMVATVAVVLSMFAGIAFAAVTDVDKIILSTTSTVLTGKGMQELVIHGQVVKADGTLATIAANDVTVTKGTADVSTNLTVNTAGTFTYREIVTDGKAANYTFTSNAKTAVFALKYDMQLTNRSDISFNLSDASQEAIIGVLKYADGTVVKGVSNAVAPAVNDEVKLHWLNADGTAGAAVDVNAKSGVTDNGQFGLFTPTAFSKAGKIGLFVNGVKHVTGEVTAYGMNVKATPSTGIAHTVADSKIKLELSKGPATDGSYAVEFVVKNGDKTVTNVQTAGVNVIGFYSDEACNTSVGANLAFVSGKATVYMKTDFNHADLKAGTYTVSVTVASQYKASATLSVVNPATYTLVDKNGKLGDQAVSGDHTITVGNTAGRDIVIAKYSSSTTSYPNLRYVVFVNGDQKLEYTDGQTAQAAADYTVTIKPSGAATRTVRIVAYEKGANDTGYTTKVLDKTYTINYKGWNVTYEVKTVILREETEITFVVKDLEGKPVNNALIQIVGDDGQYKNFVNPTTTSISNGEYTAKVKYNQNAGPLYVRAIKVSKVAISNTGAVVAGDQMATFTNGLTVIGRPVYTVTANVDSLLLGLKQKVVLTATDGSNTFIPSVVYQQVGTGQPTSLGISPKSDGTFEVTVTPKDATKDITLRAENADGTKTGSITFKVVKPKLVFAEKSGAVAENYNSYVEFKVIDPRNENVIKNQLDLSYGNYINANNVVILDNAKNEAGNNNLLGSELHQVYFRISSVDWTTADTDSKTVEIRLTAKLDADAAVDGTILVKKATLTSNPETVILGQANNLVLTLADANGNAIAGKKVYLGEDNKGALVGTTDDKGQVTYATAAAGTFAAVTDVSGKYVTKQVVAGVDNKAPVVSAPETSDKNTATITITDNVRVIRVRINGVEDTAFFPGATYTKVVNLVPGDNKFTVEAMDNNYNTVNETVTIKYASVAGNSTVLKGAAVERQGNFLFVQIRKFEELGAKLTWNGTTKTATFVAGGKTVEVVVGSTTAKVNGVAATMPAAPKLVNGRVLVPTRFISEALGWKVDWAAGDIVTITLP